ncbi:MAG TPA: hypothetical protein VFV00_03095 [Acidimicrobiales bacterium]|nr:hypothetical protein [Acidimicrobiales bacterium]
MTERGDQERELADVERQRAARRRIAASMATTDDDRELHERAAWFHDEAARLHAHLADVYDREEASSSN